MANYKLSGDSKGETLVVVYEDGEPVTVPDTHPSFDDILALLRAGDTEDDRVKELVNKLHVVGKKLSEITDRVSVAAYGVFFDGDPLRSELADVILELFKSGNEKDLGAVAKFIENAAANQTMEGVDALYRWISNRQLTLTPDGMFLAYKAIKEDVDGNPVSITAGNALVNGEVFEGNIPNPVGAVVTMPRSEVTDKTSVNCGPGLHAGTYDYAKWFASAGWSSEKRFLVLVEINPRDVVSVPSDHNCAKLRVSRYKVLEQIELPLEVPVYTPPTYEDDESYDSEADEWMDDVDDEWGSDDWGYDGEDDGDFTETGPVDEPVVNTESLKDELERTLAGDKEDEEQDDESLTVDGSISSDSVKDEEEKKAEAVEDAKPETKVQKFKHWLLGD
jgi:hypothetical protein